MHIRELSLRDFRSWKELHLELQPGVTLFVGRNGYGKTNIVEAVGFAAHLSSHRVSKNSPLIRAGAPDARVSATAVNGGRELTVHVLLKAQGGNRAQINRAPLKSPREALGVVRSVLFAPEDLSLVRGEPGERRHYLDAIIASRTPRLAGAKADYDKVLRQRNALLKNAAAVLRRGEEDSLLATLDVWDEQLSELGGHVIHARHRLVAELSPEVHNAYAVIAPESRPATLQYHCTVPLPAEIAEHDPATVGPEVWGAAMLAELGSHRSREIDRGLSLVGPHRDDLFLMLGDHPAKGFASHGETWSFAIALRFGEFSLLRGDGTDPILILDDVFAELDARRREKLVQLASNVEQVLITAAVDEDLPGNLGERISARYTITVEDTEEGRVSRIDD